MQACFGSSAQPITSLVIEVSNPHRANSTFGRNSPLNYCKSRFIDVGSGNSDTCQVMKNQLRQGS
jgi:hypothetical protein